MPANGNVCVYSATPSSFVDAGTMPMPQTRLSVCVRSSTHQYTELELEPRVLTRLDEIFPGPGGQAPEAYAW